MGWSFIQRIIENRLGNPQNRTNNKSISAMMGVPDIPGETIYAKIEGVGGGGGGSGTLSAYLSINPWPATTEVLDDAVGESIKYHQSGTTSSVTFVELAGYTLTSNETGAKTLASLFLSLHWKAGVNSANGGVTKWVATQGTSYNSGTAEDVTDAVNEVGSQVEHTRSGAIKPPNQNALPMRLSLLGKVNNGADEMSYSIANDTYLESVYKI